MDGRSFYGKTLTFLVILVFIGVFVMLFGTTYALVGMVVSTTALTMLSKDLSVRPFSNLLSIAVFMMLLGIGAYLAGLDPYLGLVVNFVAVFLTVFLTMHDLNSPMYFPMLVCYAMMLTIHVDLMRLPDRLFLLAVSAVFIVGLNVLVNRGSRNRLSHQGIVSMCEGVKVCISRRIAGEESDVAELESLCAQLNRSMYDRLRSRFFTTPKDRTVLDLVVSLLDLGRSVCDRDVPKGTMEDISKVMDVLISHEHGETSALDVSNAVDEFFHRNPDTDFGVTAALRGISAEIVDLAAPRQRTGVHIRGFDFRGAMNTIREEGRRDSVRFSFAVRMGIMFSLVAFAWQYWSWDNAQWLLFTVIATVVPFVEDSWKKSAMRLTGTLAGTAAFLVVSWLAGSNVVAVAAVAMVAGYAYVIVDQDRDDHKLFFFTLLVLLASSMVSTSSTLASDRILFTLAGILVAIVANRVILPYRISDENIELASRSMAISNERIRNIRDALDGRTDAVEDAGLTVLSASISQKMRVNASRSEDTLTMRFLNSQDSLSMQCSSLVKAIPAAGVECREMMIGVIDGLLGGADKGAPMPDTSSLGAEDSELVLRTVSAVETYRANRSMVYDMIVSRYSIGEVCLEMPSR